ncbi:MAG: metalloprotease PmbA [Pseudomonadales bacterium]|jgi:PmbA protein|nr:metalloprotease PmbA [Pseudomonadales bacterium]MDP6470836.1 metalloprotease PmbA [Pseudomonadales bacterium]MDP6825979.1 metalloprotease PmbA [Pseudomonadales bacterium]MDP6972291.1 metalloprotease PmbA [Pseudomonadales bacterium]|tara:strand:+ start:2921 stop:4279 length:1359 start_codon:yes stop_codon:yes gene_type:complete
MTVNDVVATGGLSGEEDTLNSLVSEILGEAQKQGATAAEVSVTQDEGLAVTVRNEEIETVEFNQDRGFGIAVYVGKCKGSASTSDSSIAAISDTVRAALDIARHTQEDPASGLADAERMATLLPDLDLYHPMEMTTDQAVEIALECEKAGLGHDERIRNSDGVQVSSQQSCRVYGNSHGFIGSYLATRFGTSCVFIGEDDNGMQRDYWYTVARDFDVLDAPEAVGIEAARRTVARLSPRKVATGSYPVLFSPQMASGLISHLLGAISGGALYRKASFLLDSMGQTVMAKDLTVVEEPHLSGRLGSAAFDGEGVGTWSKAFVEQGVVENYVLSSYSARKLELETTGNAGGVHNVSLRGDARPFASLLEGMGDGLYVTELMGQGVNGVTGDYSRGASGFWVEGGEICYPVDEVTIAGNLKDMLKNLVAIGDDVDLRLNVATPSVLVGELMVAGE